MDVRGALRTPRLHAKICTSGSARPPAPLCGLAHVAPRSSSRRRSLAVRASAVVSEPAVVTRSTPVPAPAPPAPATELVPPAGAYAKAVAAGAAKAALPAGTTLVLGVLAGAFIGFGSFLALSVGGACPGLASANPGLQKMVLGAFGLPFGLLMVLVCGGELFTGNTALVTVAAYEGKATPGQLMKNWLVSYAGNFLGSALVVALVAASGVMASAKAPAAVAVAKTSLTFTQAFARGVLANWLVCVAVWQAGAASSLPGKFLGAWLPVSAFVALGLEHSIANMWMIPMGMVLGAPVTVSDFLLRNLLPVTLGNIVGGALCMATAYSLCYGRLRRAQGA